MAKKVAQGADELATREWSLKEIEDIYGDVRSAAETLERVLGEMRSHDVKSVESMGSTVPSSAARLNNFAGKCLSSVHARSVVNEHRK
jgi:hypothetical protein